MERLSTQGEVVFVPYPYSDLSATQLRPAVVLAAIERGDIVLCQVTSNPFTDPRAVELVPDDFESDPLPVISYARPGKLFTGHVSVIKDRVGRLQREPLHRLTDAVVQVLRQGR